MSYIKAIAVVSPKTAFTMVRVLVDPGPGDVSYACGFWEGVPVLVERWNGDDASPVGLPQSRGLPVWFVVPDEQYHYLLPLFEKKAPAHIEFLRGFLALKSRAA